MYRGKGYELGVEGEEIVLNILYEETISFQLKQNKEK